MTTTPMTSAQAEKLWRQHNADLFTYLHASGTDDASLVFLAKARSHRKGFLQALVLTGQMEAK